MSWRSWTIDRDARADDQAPAQSAAVSYGVGTDANSYIREVVTHGNWQLGTIWGQSNELQEYTAMFVLKAVTLNLYVPECCSPIPLFKSRPGTLPFQDLFPAGDQGRSRCIPSVNASGASAARADDTEILRKTFEKAGVLNSCGRYRVRSGSRFEWIAWLRTRCTWCVLYHEFSSELTPFYCGFRTRCGARERTVLLGWRDERTPIRAFGIRRHAGAAKFTSRSREIAGVDLKLQSATRRDDACARCALDLRSSDPCARRAALRKRWESILYRNSHRVADLLFQAEHDLREARRARARQRASKRRRDSGSDEGEVQRWRWSEMIYIHPVLLTTYTRPTDSLENAPLAIWRVCHKFSPTWTFLD
ncbi:hypothetical protein B0H14DRAFT_2629260 [Mycena olivaceomarginata]|nr:hypothetical protein B0H14DRAFT_2629260 [Mycena olivaceomarginata]